MIRCFSFNRTRVELKLAAIPLLYPLIHTFNRTRVELKFDCNGYKRLTSTFNRTRVELKFDCNGYKRLTSTFNRTRVELKLIQGEKHRVKLASFNRTRVELKLIGLSNRLPGIRLLIAQKLN